jgi:hypothetical protein
MKKETIELKFRLNTESPTFYLMKRLKECEKFSQETIKFNQVFSKICSIFSMPKKDVWRLLYSLHDLSLITIIPHHGVVLNYDFINGELRV